jgi:hypothetical protein
MIYVIFASLGLGILALKFADKLLWEERKIRRRKERRIAWNKKQKGTRYGKGTRKRNKPRTRKNKRH